MTDPILQVERLSIVVGAKESRSILVSDVNFTVQPGTCMGIVGESGSGKTMTALSLMQLLPAAARVSEQSRILLRGRNLLDLSERDMRYIRGRKIAMIFQDAMSALNPVFTIGQQIREVLATHQRMRRRHAKQKALQLLEEVGIHEPLHCYRSYPHQLSGGMRQRAMIAMALCCKPEILIADEPTTALDVTIQAQVLALLNELKQKHQMTLLFISHDLAVVSQLADTITVLQNGMLVESATADNFFRNPQSAYSQQLLAAIPGGQTRQSPLETTTPLLNVEQLKVHFPIKKGILKRTVGHVKAVDGIGFDLASGETLALVGESGSGKTTTGKAILKLLQKTTGQIYFNGGDMALLSARKMRQLRRHMQIIFQDPYAALNPRMMIKDCIAEGLIAQKMLKSRKALEQRIDILLTQVEMDTSAKWRYPHEFSGGQRQRICIARALALEPDLLILDEPTSALDVSIQMQILKLLEQLQQKLGLSYLLITHNLSVVAYLAHKTAVMYRGAIVEQGATQDILHNPQHPYTQQLMASVPQLKTREAHNDFVVLPE